MIGVATVLSVAAVSWLVSPALAQGRSTPIALKASAAQGSIPQGSIPQGSIPQGSIPQAATPAPAGGPPSVGAPLSTSAAIRPAAITPFEMSYGKKTRQTYLAYLPTTRTTKIAVIVIHGGGWVAGSAEDTDAYNERLYGLGVASFSIDYRYASDAPWPAQRDDLAAALAQIRANSTKWNFNPDSIAVIGISAGGHMALDLASGQGREATCAVVSYSGPTSMKLVLASAAQGVKQKGLAKSARELAPTAAAKKSATLPHSPSATDAPALLYAAEFDWVDYNNTSAYGNAYAGIDLDVESVILAGEHRHASGYALNVPKVWTDSLDFISRHCS